jgi:hypothetical protein
MAKPKITIDQILQRRPDGQDELKSPWIDVGQTYNDESGVDQLVAKQVGSSWVYVQIEWHYRSARIGFILKDGVKYD